MKILYLTKDFYLENIKNIYNSIIKKTTSILKAGKRFEQMLHKRRHMGDRQAHEKMINIIRKILTETTTECCHAPTRVAKMKKTKC